MCSAIRAINLRFGLQGACWAGCLCVVDKKKLRAYEKEENTLKPASFLWKRTPPPMVVTGSLIVGVAVIKPEDKKNRGKTK